MLDEAIENYGIALVLKPDFAEAYVHLGIVYQNQGDLDKAEERFRICINNRIGVFVIRQPPLFNEFSKLGMILNHFSQNMPDSTKQK